MAVGSAGRCCRFGNAPFLNLILCQSPGSVYVSVNVAKSGAGSRLRALGEKSASALLIKRTSEQSIRAASLPGRLALPTGEPQMAVRERY